MSGPNENGGTPEGSIAGGSTVTVTGTNFFDASNFATQVWFCTSSSNCLQASNVNVQSNSLLTATSPAVTSATSWYVQVTTIGGTASDTQATFAYSVQVPLIISLSPSSGGPSSTGTSLTITGSNFLTGSTAVAFCLASSYNAGAGTCGTSVSRGHAVGDRSDVAHGDAPDGHEGSDQGGRVLPHRHDHCFRYSVRLAALCRAG